MDHALTISGLTKTYKDFILNQVSFTVPKGSIVGLVGENGAGKSTTINAALGLIQKEAGTVSILGREKIDNETKEQIGVVFAGSNYPEILSPQRLNQVMKKIYHSWDEQTYMHLLKKFSLPPDKRIRHFSKGMKMKLAISVALSHHCKFLILDEATSGLDPVIRDDILDMMLDFVQDEDHSVHRQTRLSSKGKLPYPSPFLPKIKGGCSFKEIYYLEAFSIYPLNSRIPLFSRLSLSYRSNKKRPHRKDCFLSTRPFTCFLFSFWGYPKLPSQDIRVCLWIWRN